MLCLNQQTRYLPRERVGIFLHCRHMRLASLKLLNRLLLLLMLLLKPYEDAPKERNHHAIASLTARSSPRPKKIRSFDTSLTLIREGFPLGSARHFDEARFQIGVIRTMKVITSSERRARPDLVQPRDREWVPLIQGISAAGFVIPPFTIYKGKIHLSSWHEDRGILADWVITVSEIQR